MEAMAVIWKPEFPHRRHHEVLTKDINFCNESVLLRTYYKPEALKIFYFQTTNHIKVMTVVWFFLNSKFSSTVAIFPNQYH